MSAKRILRHPSGGDIEVTSEPASGPLSETERRAMRRALQREALLRTEAEATHELLAHFRDECKRLTEALTTARADIIGVNTAAFDSTRGDVAVRAKAASWIIDVERHERIQMAVQRVADAMRDNELLTERVVHPLIFALEREIERQDEKHGRYEGTMLGRSRLALGTLEDEVAEALKAWRDERAATHWEATRAEVLQVAAVAIRTLRDAL